MKRLPPDPAYAVDDVVLELARRFQYPDADTVAAAVSPGGGGGMAHVLIVSDSEPQFVRDKADYVVPRIASAATLQSIFDGIDDTYNGPWTIWMAGIFELDADVTAPSSAWIRGLGWTTSGGPG